MTGDEALEVVRAMTAALAEHERTVRDRERRRVLAVLQAVGDREDETGFAPGGLI